MMQGIRIAAATAASAVVSLGMAFAQDNSPEATGEATPLFVRTMIVGEADQLQQRQFFGRIAALETTELSFEVPGYLSVLDAPRGTRIAAGERLASLDLSPFARALERAELTLAQAERDVERLQTLASRNVSSEVRAQDAQTARDLAEVAVRDASAALEDAQLIAPFDGIVADRLVATYTNVTPGQPIVRLHNMSETRVEFDLPERILAVIGDPSLVEFSTILPGQTDPVRLAFREIQAETGAVGQSYTISLAIAGAVSARVLPGKTATVTARLPEQSNAIPIPATAVVTQPNGATVVIAVTEKDGTLRSSFIPVEVQSATGVDLVVNGLEPGTEIVKLGGHLIAPDTDLARYAGLIVEGN